MRADEVKQIFREALSTSFGAPITEKDWTELAIVITKHVGPHYQRQAINRLEAELVNVRDQLTAALKEKNAALLQLANEQTATRNYMHSERAVKKQLADTLSHVETLDECVAERDERIRTLLQEAKMRTEAHEKQVSELAGIIGDRERELAKLKPPEPKFRVGQVVTFMSASIPPANQSRFGKITAREWSVKGGHWEYDWSCSHFRYSHSWEENLRALTDEER